jgi:hypothetical protein
MTTHNRAKALSASAAVRPSRHWLWIGLCFLSLCGTSCTTPQKPNLMGDTFHDDMVKDSATIRPADAPTGEFDGMSAKSQQIERDLGIR